MKITDEMVKTASEALANAPVVTVSGKYAGRRDLLSFRDFVEVGDASDAIDLGVSIPTKDIEGKPMWHGYSDIRNEEIYDTIIAMLTVPMRAALEAVYPLIARAEAEECADVADRQGYAVAAYAIRARHTTPTPSTPQEK